ncbi:16S rRNA (cytosine(967)-C(5))-methyltransferase RsmB [Sporolactobacillus pectinivorans]|uniref:16S rRNA (cytosine(967)-C(5))-methyltransferase RsmB n=1 Tax=Sporolactobacillus pectinivorans TaxID=1591408 RepID=UPI000C26AE4E|nr:16S rRNA (cytosine(967)-C(5))-methyltransferase RsmB [Sporolactobacillus pectinivorans]
MNKISTREMALDLLLSITKEQSYSQLALNDALSEQKWPERDKGLVTTLVYGVLQRNLTLEYILSTFTAGKKLDDWVRILLMISIYQKMYLDRIPDHAIVNEAVNIAGKRGHRGISGFVNAVLRRFLREGVPDFSGIHPESRRLSVVHSHPEWLLALWESQWDRETALKIADSDNQPPQVFVRVNRTRITKNELISRLESEGIQVSEGLLSPDCLRIDSGHAAGSRAFASGLMTIQDESSMLVADALSPKEGMAVLDACAGPGGKTTHLGERMHNKGKIIALDLHEHKTKLIDRSAERLGLSNIETRAMDARTAGELLGEESFDRVLLDVPCSGLGVIRRKPEIRWAKTARDINRLVAIQREILDHASRLVRRGGWLVYSTCTINRDENERQLSRFIASHPDFEWEPDLFSRFPNVLKECRVSEDAGMIQLLPFQFGTDGFFIGCLRKKR